MLFGATFLWFWGFAGPCKGVTDGPVLIAGNGRFARPGKGVTC